jgi:hypothetical protein
MKNHPCVHEISFMHELKDPSYELRSHLFSHANCNSLSVNIFTYSIVVLNNKLITSIALDGVLVVVVGAISIVEYKEVGGG